MPSLADILPRLTQCQIFAGLIRDVDSVSARLADDAPYVVVLAPDNAALHALNRKPWRSSRDEEQFGTEAYEGQVGAQRASDNIQTFVERQMVVLSAEWRQGERAKTMNGKQVWWETIGEVRVVSFRKNIYTSARDFNDG